jgi:hypothetical protein
MEAWIVEILKQYGLAGAVIFCLVLVVIAQSRTIRERDIRLAGLHEQRARERERLVELLEAANTAQRLTADTTAKRNEIMDDLAGAIVAQANSSDRLNDRVAGQAEMFKDKFNDVRHVIDATGESYRVLNGLVTEIRNVLSLLTGQVASVAVDVKRLGP